MQNSDVGALRLNPPPPTSMLLDVLEDELKATTSRAIKCSKLRGIIKCTHLFDKTLLRARKRVKVDKSQSTLILNIDFNAWTIFRYENMVQSVVWLIPFETLEDLLALQANDIISHGEFRLVTSQSVDKRRIHVKPPLNEKENADREDLILVLMADIHQMVFLYENFKATAKRLRDAPPAPPTEAEDTTKAPKNKPDDVMVSNQLEASSRKIPKTMVQICLAALAFLSGTNKE